MSVPGRGGVLSGVLTVLLLGCASDPAKTSAKGLHPNEGLLALETRLKASRVEVILSDRWSKEGKLEALHVEASEGGVQKGMGQAVYTLRRLRIEAREEIKITYLPDHENLLIHARDVESYYQKKLHGDGSRSSFLQRADACSMLTIANGTLHIFP